jgi:hypothetical protein
VWATVVVECGLLRGKGRRVGGASDGGEREQREEREVGRRQLGTTGQPTVHGKTADIITFVYF